MERPVKFWGTAISYFKNLARDDTVGQAARTAFYLMLSLLPMLLFLVATLGQMRLTLDGQMLSKLFPESVSQLLFSMVDGAPAQQTGLWSAVLSLWTGSAALWALMLGVYRAETEGHQGRTPPFWARLVSVAFLLGFTLIGGLSLLLVVFGERWTAPLLDRLGYAQPWLYGVLPYAGIFFGLFAVVLLLYRFTPGVKKKLRQLWPGALLAAAGWTLASLLFELYITLFTNYGTLYGGLGTFLGLLMWLFVISLVILAGAELNALLAQDGG